MSDTPSHTFTLFWECWAIATFAAFAIVEIYALCTNWRNTLSANVWRALRETPNQSVLSWSALHFVGAGMWIVVSVWLFGHFFFMRWRA